MSNQDNFYLQIRKTPLILEKLNPYDNIYVTKFKYQYYSKHEQLVRTTDYMIDRFYVPATSAISGDFIFTTFDKNNIPIENHYRELRLSEISGEKDFSK